MDETNNNLNEQEIPSEKKKKHKAGKIIAVILVLAALSGGAFLLYRFLNREDAGPEGLVYVNSVSDIIGGDYMNANRYMGVVEAQETKSIQKDSDKKIKEIFVEVEAEVKEGDKLFEYDTEEMELKLKQMELELSRINNSISTMNQQINSLAKERDEAPPESRLSYTAQIQNYQAQINQANYEVSAKQLEIENQKKSMENAVVTSPMNGVIKEINYDEKQNGGGSDYDSDSDYDSGFSYSSGSSDQNAFIKIMAKGQYRIKATADEVSVRTMSQGDPVICHTRIGEPMSWTGTIGTIDLEHPANGNNNNDYYYYGGGGETTTDYPFYIELDSVDGLMLGQHVYVEPDRGQGEQKDGIWLDAYYIVMEEAGSFVWTEENGKIKKKAVTLGEYDEDLMKYEIKDGLTPADYIAYPEDRLLEGMKTTRNLSEYEKQRSEQNGGEDLGDGDDGLGEDYYDGDDYVGDGTDYRFDVDVTPDGGGLYDDMESWDGLEGDYYEEEE